MSGEYPQTTSQLFNALQNSKEYIQERVPPAGISIVLGSGLSNFASRLENVQTIPFEDIPYLPVTTVFGHKGGLFYGTVNGVSVYCWGGRLHGYEGYANYQIAYIAHLSAFLGCQTLLVTNASGASIRDCKPGDIILVKDHINHFCKGPLDTYLHSLFRNAHPDLDYDTSIREYAKQVAGTVEGLGCFEGTYFWVRGPAFETAYEIESYTKLGGDMYGMSTVPEVMAAQAHGMRVLVVSVVANLAAGLKDEVLSHELVFEGIKKVQNQVESYFVELITNMPPFEGKIEVNWKRESEHPVLYKNRVGITHADILRGTEFLKGFCKHNVEVAVVINAHQEPELDSARHVYYRELPNFPVYTVAGKKGKVVMGKLDHKWVVCLVNKDLEGLSVYESYYLVQVLLGLGVGHLHYILPALSEPSDSFLRVKDYFEFHLQYYAEKPCSNPGKLVSLGESYVLAFPGPALPSKAERELAQRIKFDLATIANMAILGESSNRGLDHSCVCFPCNFESESLTRPTLNAYLGQFLNTLNNTVCPGVSIVAFPSHSGCQLVEAPSSPKELEVFGQQLKQEFSPKFTVIASEAIGSLLLPQVSIIKSIAFNEFLPHTLHFLENGVLLVVGDPILREEDNHQRMLYPVFLSNLMEVDKVLIIEEFTSCRRDIELGSWFRVKNHCGFSVSSPLFGPNVDNWGVRFTDVNNIYTMNEHFKEVFGTRNIPCREGNLIYTNTLRPVFSSAIEKLGSFCDADVVGKYGVHAVNIAAHKPAEEKFRKVMYIGYVSSETHSEVKANPPNAEHINAILELINSLNI